MEPHDHSRGEGGDRRFFYPSDLKVREGLGGAINSSFRLAYAPLGEDGRQRRTRGDGEARDSPAGLPRLFGADYIDAGMIHYCDLADDWRAAGLLSPPARLAGYQRGRAPN